MWRSMCKDDDGGCQGGIEIISNNQPPRIIRHTSAKVYNTGSGPSIDSVDPSHRVSEVWCFSDISFWSYSYLLEVKLEHSYVWKNVYYLMPLPVASLKQLSASFLQHQEAPRHCYHMPDFCSRSCHWH